MVITAQKYMEYLYPLVSLIFLVVAYHRLIDVVKVFRGSNYNTKLFLQSLNKHNPAFLHRVRKISKILVFILFIPASFTDSSMTAYHLFIIGTFTLDLFAFIGNYKKVITTRTARRDIYILIPTVILIFLLYLNPLVDKLFWLFLLERISIIFYLFFAFCLSFPFELYEDTQVEKVKRLKNLHTLIFSAVIISKDNKIFLDHMHVFLSAMNTKVAKIYLDKNIGGLTNFLITSIKNNIEITFVGVSLSQKNVEQIVEILRPQIVVKPFSLRVSYLVNEASGLRVSLQNTLYSAKRKMNDDFISSEKNSVIRLYEAKKGDLFRGHGQLSIFISELKITREGIVFQLTFDRNQYMVQTAILGVVEIVAILPAVLIALKVGLNQKEIVRCLSRLKPLKGYMYPFVLSSKSKVIDYSSGSLDSLDSALFYLGIYNRKKILFLNSNLFENASSTKIKNIFSRIDKVCNYCIVFNNQSISLIEKYAKISLVRCKMAAMEDFELVSFLIKNLKDDDIAIGIGTGTGMIISKLIYRYSFDLSN